MIRALLAAVVALAVLLTACIGQQPDSRYSIARDGAPLKAIGPENVTDAVPRADPILPEGNRSPYEVNGVSYDILPEARGYRARGTASWYGTKFHGHKTSNGEVFDLYQATAAHKTLPIPCYALVTNLDNGRQVVVRVNDRGPFHADRLIDLSYAAAVKLGYMEQGTARVEVQVMDIAGVDDRRGTAAGEYRYLQLGAFSSETSARRLQAELERLLTTPVAVSPVEADGRLLYRVRVGPVASNEDLLALRRQLEDGGYGAGQPLP